MKKRLWGVVLVVFFGFVEKSLLGGGEKDGFPPSRPIPVEVVTQGNSLAYSYDDLLDKALELESQKELIEKLIGEKLQDLGMKPPTFLEKVVASLPSVKGLLLLTASGVALTYIWKFRYWASRQDLDESDTRKQQALETKVKNINENFTTKSDETNTNLTEINNGSTKNLTDLRTYVGNIQLENSKNEQAIQKQQTAIEAKTAMLKEELTTAQSNQKVQLSSLGNILKENSGSLARKEDEFKTDLHTFLDEQKTAHKNQFDLHQKNVDICKSKMQELTDPEALAKLVGNLKQITKNISSLDGKLAVSAQKLDNVENGSKNTTEQLQQQLEEEKQFSEAIEKINSGVFADVKKTLSALKEISQISIEKKEKSVSGSKGSGNIKTTVIPVKGSFVAFKPAGPETSNPSEKHKNQSSSALVKKNSPTQLKFLEGSNFGDEKSGQD